MFCFVFFYSLSHFSSTRSLLSTVSLSFVFFLFFFFFVVVCCVIFFFFFFSSRRRHTRCLSDWSSDVCSSDLAIRNGFLERLGQSIPVVEPPLPDLGKGENFVKTGQFLGAVDPGDDFPHKIGRASCRERV